jgi:hypothetical protein
MAESFTVEFSGRALEKLIMHQSANAPVLIGNSKLAGCESLWNYFVPS